MASLSEQKAFIEQIGPLIQIEAKQRGYKVCSPVIAQAVIESAYGTSKLASVWGNFFGLKCGSSWKGPSVNLATKEEYNSVLVSIKDNFRVFQTDGKADMVLGVKGYFDFISTKRYANLLDATTPKEYLEFIKKDGYATSSSYVNTCMDCIGRHDLTKYDEPVNNPYKLTASVMREGSRGESVAWLQWELRSRGYDIKVDQIYGPKTKAAVEDFQQKVFVDGIVGPLTIDKLKQ